MNSPTADQFWIYYQFKRIKIFWKKKNAATAYKHSFLITTFTWTKSTNSLPQLLQNLKQFCEPEGSYDSSDQSFQENNLFKQKTKGFCSQNWSKVYNNCCLIFWVTPLTGPPIHTAFRWNQHCVFDTTQWSFCIKRKHQGFFLEALGQNLLFLQFCCRL